MANRLADFFHLCSPVSDGCSIDWTAWATIGTLLAVYIALKSAGDAADLIEKHRKEDRQRAIEEREVERIAIADRLSLSLDYELFRYGNNIVSLVNGMKTAAIWEDPAGALDFFHAQMDKEPIPLLNRFIDQLGAYGSEAAAKLVLVVATHQAIMEGAVASEELAGIPHEALRTGMLAVRAQLIFAANQIQVARAALAGHVQKFRPTNPPIAAVEPDQLPGDE